MKKISNTETELKKIYCLYKKKRVPNLKRVYNIRLSFNIPPIKVRHDHFKTAFFPSAILEWNKLDFNIRNSASLNTFERKLLNFIRPFTISLKSNPRLRQFYEHKFRHWFQDT